MTAKPAAGLRRRLVPILAAVGLLVLPAPAAEKASDRSADYLNSNRQLCQLLPSDWRPGLISLGVDKSNYCLTVYYARKPMKQYPVVFGPNPVDDKLRQGDCCTPEGRFTVLYARPNANWRKFIRIDYPTSESWTKHQRAKRAGRIPKRAAIGGMIGIHGVPEGSDDLIDRRVNWTLGCVSLKNHDIDEVYSIVRPGTRVVIIH